MCERTTYYTFAGSQRNLLQRMGFSNAQSTSMNAAFSILCYITPLLGGWLADAQLGRYRTILWFAIIYVVGNGLAAVSAWPTLQTTWLYLFSTMALVTLGCGGIKPNIANFGGDQYDTSDPQQQQDQKSFFNYFYLVINIGAAVAYGYLVTLATNGQPPGIPQDYGFFAAYAIAAGCFFLCVGVFVLGTPRYTRKPPGGDSLRGLIYYMRCAASAGSWKGIASVIGWALLLLFLCVAVAQAFITDTTVAMALSYASFGLSVVACVVLVWVHCDNRYLDGILDEPRGMMSLEEAKATLDTVPTLIVVNIAFNICYNQMSGTFQAQACQMNLMVGSGQINGAFFNIGDCFAIVLFTPIYEMFLLPLLGRLQRSPVTGMQQVVAGLVVAALARSEERRVRNEWRS
eukprot:RCo047784